MTSISASHTKTATATGASYPPGEILHRVLLAAAIIAAASLIPFLAVHGFSYYLLGLEERPFSPMHAQLRSSGTIGLRLGILSLIMFGILFLYPLRNGGAGCPRLAARGGG